MATKNIAIACQGGGSHAAFTAGVLPGLMTQFDNVRAARTAADECSSAGAPIPVLVGLSGTSGGAISALLGWYGFITGGAQEAQRKLDLFWTNNSATLPGEHWINFWSRQVSDFCSYFADVKYSPYTVPLEPIEWYCTSLWPRLAGANPFVRADYFQPEQLLEPCVHFGLVEALGEFASIPCDVSRWMESELESSVFPPSAPCQLRYREEQTRLAERIAAHVKAAGAIGELIDELKLPEGSLLRAAFRRWVPPLVQFDRVALARLSDAVKEVTRYIPTLLVGAVELRKGAFTAFSSERTADDGGITLESVLASASLPWLVKARRVRQVDPATGEEKWRSYWDGLFSQNPPIKNFMSCLVDERKKPDKLWIVQINPDEASVQPGRRRDFPDRFLEAGAIWEVRNSLAGNISLNQEIGFVEAINRRVALEGDAADDKPVQIDRIVLDGDAVAQASGTTLGPNSKMDRDERLKDALVDHGRQQAARFLALRSGLGQVCGTLGQMLASACDASAKDACAESARTSGVQGTVWAEELMLHRVGEPRPYGTQARIRWRARDATVNGTPMQLEGESELYAHPNPGTEWRLKDVRITCMQPVERPQARPLPVPIWTPVELERAPAREAQRR